MHRQLITRPEFEPITVVPHELDDTHPLFGGEASTLFGNHTEPVDFDFEPEPAPQQVIGRPEWSAWLRYSRERYELAVRELAFVKTEGGLYHYVHRVTGEQYQIPTHDEWNRYHREDDEMERRFGHRPAFWKKVIKIFLLVALVAALLAIKAGDNSRALAEGIPQAILQGILMTVLLGTPLLLLVRHISRPSPASMPEHRMFYTPAEQAEVNAKARREEMTFWLILGGALGFLAFRRIMGNMHEHHDD
jgi:hypothetical protein